MHPFCHVITFCGICLKINIPLIHFLTQKNELIIININQRNECLKDGKFLLCSASFIVKIRQKKIALHFQTIEA